jgi:uncharacterized protein YbjQ (UPF0145 family)
MANCCICQNKIGILDDTRLLIKHDKDTPICENCYNNLCDLQSGNYDHLSSFNKACNYFHKFIDSKSITGRNEKLIINYLDEIETNVNEQIEIEKIALGINNDNVEYDMSLKGSSRFLMTTGYNFEGYTIEDYKNIISGEAVIGTGFLSELGAQISDTFGRTNQGFKAKISYAKQLAIKDMIAEAKKLRANAIIGISFNIFNTINNMFIISVNGTAVNISKNQSPNT